MKTKKIWLIGIGILSLVCVAGISYLGSYYRRSEKKEASEAVTEIHLGAVLEEGLTFPEGESVENNRFLDWIREDLQIQIVYDWIYSVDEFDRNLNLHIECDELPDALMVNEEQYRQMLKYDQLQPVTEVYQNVTSDQMKAFVESGGEEMMETVMEDGEMMAIPFPNLTASGINVMWIRQEWLDTLGLEVPETIEEIQEVSEAFVEHQMGGEGTIPSSVVVLGKFRRFLFTSFIPTSPDPQFSPYFQHFFVALWGLFLLQHFFLYDIIIALYSTLCPEVFYGVLLKKR